MRQKDSETYGFTLIAIGLLFGFFLGGSIVYWYTNLAEDSLTTDQALNRLSKLFHNSDGDAESMEANQHPYITNPKTEVPSLAEQSGSGHNNTSYQGNQPDATPPDSIFSDPAKVTATHDDNERVSGTPEQTENYDGTVEGGKLSGPLTDDLYIKKDQLIGIRGFYLPKHDAEQGFSTGTQTLDSLIRSDQRYERHRKVFYIEFWESPLNYSAYRMTRNRIIIYGIDQIDFVGLQNIESTLFLKYFDDYFPLESTSEYLPLIPVSNPQLINKIEQLWP